MPNLEIETGEIDGAGHASATGRFDDEQLFYLQIRGIAEPEARRLVVHGFFNDLIRRIGVPDLQERLMRTVEDELAKDVPAGSLSMTFEQRLRSLADVPADEGLGGRPSSGVDRRRGP